MDYIFLGWLIKKEHSHTLYTIKNLKYLLSVIDSGSNMSLKLKCKNIEMKSEVIEERGMDGVHPIVNRSWYCHADEINDYISECSEDCPYYIK